MSHPTIAGTGHRPDKLGGYGPAAFARLVALATEAIGREQPQHVISGMALGWDQALAQACVNLGVFWTAAVPFEGQEMAWPESSQRAYRALLERANNVHIVCPGGYASSKMQRRNAWMVDNCTLVLALWNGSAGGTANCVRYAKERGRDVANLWEQYNTAPCSR